MDDSFFYELDGGAVVQLGPLERTADECIDFVVACDGSPVLVSLVGMRLDSRRLELAV